MQIRKSWLLFTALLLLVTSGVFAQKSPAPPSSGAKPAIKKDAPKKPDKAAGAALPKTRNAVSVDIVPLAKGIIAFDTNAGVSVFGISAEYERILVPHYSVGGRVDFYGVEKDDEGLKTNGTYLGFAAQGRWYPFSEPFEKFFWGVGIGFNILTVKDGGGEEIKTLGMSGMTFTMKAGWKLFFVPKVPALFVEPSIAYALAKSSAFTSVTPLGWQPGLNIGLAF